MDSRRAPVWFRWRRSASPRSSRAKDWRSTCAAAAPITGSCVRCCAPPRPPGGADMNAPMMSRRDFTAGLGALVVAFSLDPKVAFAQQATLPGSLQTNRMLDAWIRIDAEDSATVSTGKVELGQGILTALAQIAAEELDLPLGRVHMISGDTGRTPNEGVTFGSQSIEYSGTALRLAGAEVRAILIDAAAKKLGVAADTLKVSEGTISGADGRKVAYGELAAALDLKREATGKVPPKPAASHMIVGTSVPRLDIPNKVTGGPAYVQDMRPAGMLHARVVRPPRPGSRLESVDEAAAKGLPGVVAVVRDGSFLGVIAEREEQAIKVRAELAKSAKWTLGPPLPDSSKIYDHLLSLPTEDTVISEKQPAALAGGLLFADDRVLGRQRQQVIVDLGRIRQRWPERPLGALGQLSAHLDGLLLALGNDAQEAAVAHDRDDARKPFGGRLVDALEPRAGARRPHHAGVQHAGRPHVLHIGGAARHLIRNIEARHRGADDHVRSGRLRRHLAGRLALEIERGGKLAIGNFSPVGAADRAFRHLEGVGRDAELLGGGIDQDRPHLGARQAQRRAAILDRLAAERDTLVRGPAGVAGDHVDAPERQIELLGRDLGERRQDTLPELDLAGGHGRAAVRVDADPGIEHAVGLQAARKCRLLGERDFRVERKGDHEGAEPGREVAT